MPKRKSAARRPHTKKGEVSNLLCHKPGNSAFILIEGKRFCFGQYGSIEAEQARLRVWKEYQLLSVSPAKKSKSIYWSVISKNTC